MIFKHKDKFYVNNENFASVANFPTEVIVPDEAPVAAWRKSPVPTELWKQVAAFLQYTYDTHKCEGIVRLYYSPHFDAWCAYAHKQQMVRGLSVADEVSNEFNPPHFDAVQVGSVHHHCDIAASQSGTDFTDELPIVGLHITLGNMQNPKKSFHARVSNGAHFLHEINLLSFFEPPATLTGVEKFMHLIPLSSLNAEIMRNLSTCGAGDFPEEWKHNVIPPVLRGVSACGGDGKKAYEGRWQRDKRVEVSQIDDDWFERAWSQQTAATTMPAHRFAGDELSDFEKMCEEATQYFHSMESPLDSDVVGPCNILAELGVKDSGTIISQVLVEAIEKALTKKSFPVGFIADVARKVAVAIDKAKTGELICDAESPLYWEDIMTVLYILAHMSEKCFSPFGWHEVVPATGMTARETVLTIQEAITLL